MSGTPLAHKPCGCPYPPPGDQTPCVHEYYAGAVIDDQAVPPPADCDEYLTRPCLCGPACCPHCPHVTAIAGMVATRYSAQVQPRDLDVAKVAAAAERERLAAVISPESIRGIARVVDDEHECSFWNGRATALRRLADLLEGEIDG